jgi:hypothetical protein
MSAWVESLAEGHDDDELNEEKYDELQDGQDCDDVGKVIERQNLAKYVVSLFSL